MPIVPAPTDLRPAVKASMALADRLSQLPSLDLHEQHAQRLALLGDKLQKSQSTVAFCGHFSAGKSTLVNRLAGAQVLPSSPIPTSANRVLIQHGSPSATVRFHQRGEVQLPPSELNQLSALCADGDQVEAIEIHHPLAHIPAGLSVMDTPGIDSTDDAHRVATESALYLADAVFYVMDYNHVQSEVNFKFTRSLVEWGKPLYLVVNQIDKHVDLELPFDQFRQSVIDAFAGWGVHPDGLFFTSLREPDHPRNQWDALLQTLQALGENRNRLLISGVWKSAAHLMEEEEQLRQQASAQEQEQLEAEAAVAGADPYLRQAAVQTELDRLARRPEHVATEVKRTLGVLLSNAPIMPFPTKELVAEYLEARKPGFRMGFFFSAKKTEQEIERRLEALHQELTEKVTAHIHWHAQQLLLKSAEAHAWRDEGFEAAVQALSVPLEADLLVTMVKPDSLGFAEYRHQYMRDLTAEIHLRYKKAMAPLIDQMADLVRSRCEQEAQPLREEAAGLERAIAAANRLAQLGEAADAYRTAWSAILGEDPAAAVAAPPQPGLGGGGAVAADGAAAATDPAPAGAPRALGLVASADSASAPAPAVQGAERRQEAAGRLRKAAQWLAPLPGMARVAADLQARAQRLEQSRFTVALFGAFSAGKSSLANALIGAHLLPSSPNPTTAAINRILPPTPERPHGHLHVVWKRPDQFRQEVEQSLDALGLTATGEIAADLAAGAQRSREVTAPSAKPHAAFLSAAARGYAGAEPFLGREEEAGLDQFASLVADEKRSCFVEQIDIHVDCPLTRQGITLVDTPGADSINARHTGVAFDYIKNADAILFVTYYNHAFSHADREFLLQLGRVKDAFAMDKMFFLVNAADLAADEAELAQVVEHVRKNLQMCGIRQARIFPISSQTALWSRLHAVGALPGDLAAKLQQRLGAADAEGLSSLGLNASGMQEFEEAFYQFVVTDLSQMAIDAAVAEVRRAADTIAHWLDAARQDEGARTKQLQHLKLAEQKAVAAISQVDEGPEAQQVEREIDELLFYVHKRVTDRFRENFVEFFSPASLRPDSSEIKRSLDQALREVVQSIAFDLAQEMRATALRVENAVNQQGQRVTEKAAGVVQALLPDWFSPAYGAVHPPVPAFSDGRDHLSPEPFRKHLGLYRNPEHFFAGGGRDLLRGALGKTLEEPVSQYLAGARAVLADWYGSAFAERIGELKGELTAEVQDHVRGLTAALTVAGESAKLEATLQDLRRVSGS